MKHHTVAPLFWHCAGCGAHEPAQAEYEHGDTEPCIDCYAPCKVVTLEEAAEIEQKHAIRRAMGQQT